MNENTRTSSYMHYKYKTKFPWPSHHPQVAHAHKPYWYGTVTCKGIFTTTRHIQLTLVLKEHLSLSIPTCRLPTMWSMQNCRRLWNIFSTVHPLTLTSPEVDSSHICESIVAYCSGDFRETFGCRYLLILVKILKFQSFKIIHTKVNIFTIANQKHNPFHQI